MLSLSKFASVREGICNVNLQHSRCASNRAARAKGSFKDSLYVYVKGGAGGQGIERLGKIGGDGGSVFAAACAKANLSQLKTRYSGGSGKHANSQQLLIKPGIDLYLPVPRGTMVWRKDKTLLADLSQVDDQVLLVRGGKGGGPQYEKWTGKGGERAHFTLELKLIADSGLVGYPNAGKSTLLNKISRATPKMADYPFTTLRPHLGAVWYEEEGLRKVTVADLPGLIEGAHLNRGMGHKFLRHVERTRCLIFVVDVNGYKHSLQQPWLSPLQTIQSLGAELDLYQPGLCERKSLLLVNKMDSEGAEEKYQAFVRVLGECMEKTGGFQMPKFEKILPISALHSQGLEELKSELRQVVEQVNLDKEKEKEESAALTSDSDEMPMSN